MSDEQTRQNIRRHLYRTQYNEVVAFEDQTRARLAILQRTRASEGYWCERIHEQRELFEALEASMRLSRRAIDAVEGGGTRECQEWERRIDCALEAVSGAMQAYEEYCWWYLEVWGEG